MKFCKLQPALTLCGVILCWSLPVDLYAQNYIAPFRFSIEPSTYPYTSEPLESCHIFDGTPGHLSKATAFIYEYGDNYDNPVTQYIFEDATGPFVHCYGYGPPPVYYFPSTVGSVAKYHYCPYGGELFQYADTRECRFTNQPPSCPAGIDPETGLCWQSKACPVGNNPIDPASGAKLHDHLDIAQSAAAHPLSLHRYYNSQSPYWGSELSKGWNHNWQRRLVLTARQRAAPTIAVLHEGGQVSRFNRPIGSVTWVSLDQSRDTFAEIRDINGSLTGYTVKRFESDALETYSADGLLLTVRERNGWLATLRYSDPSTPPNIAPKAGLLIEVRNHFGRKLQFRYDADARLVRAIDFGGKAVRYRYDDMGRLSRVTWPDNTFRTYHYEDTRLSNALTGVTDEAGVRYATYTYDDKGRAKSTELAGGEGRVEVVYNVDGTSTVTDYSSANGATSRTYTFETAGGNIRPTAVSGPCALCGSTQQSSTYDSTTGALTKSIAHDGTVTFYKYEARGREIERATFPTSFKDATVRPPLTNATRVVSTRWHATWNLPLTVAEPNKITDYGYDGNGNLSSESWSATQDRTGAKAFDAVKTGSNYATEWGYNAKRLNNSVVDKVDAVEMQRWTLDYNTLGDTTRITDVTGGNRIATATQYDDYGLLRSGTSIDGVSIARSYTLRGQLRQRTDGGFTTTLDFNAMGLRTFARFSQGGDTEFVYDAAHKLIELRVDGSSLGPPGSLFTEPLASHDRRNSTTGRLPLEAAHAQVAPPRRLPGPILPPPPPNPIDDLAPGLGDRAQPGNVMWSAGRGLTNAQIKAQEILDECICKGKDERFPKPTYTNTTFEHIWEQGHHWSNSAPTIPGKSKFKAGIGGQSFTDNVIAKAGAPTPGTGSSLVYRVADLGYVTGTDVRGRPTRAATVVVQGPCPFKWSKNWENEVITQFPGLL